MKTVQLRFQGHSDDTFGEYGVSQIDADNNANGKPIVFRVTSLDAGLRVYGFYGGVHFPPHSPPCWIIGIQQLDEDVPIPDWPIKFETADSGYSPVLVIEVSDTFTIELMR